MPAEEMKNRSYKRRVRNVFIHKPMQREFIFVIVSLMIVASLAIAFVIHHTIHEASSGGGFQFGKISPYEVLSEVTYQLMTRVTLILIATLMVIAVFSVFFLHRVAGPVYRFRYVLLRINDGETPDTIRLREGDYFGETAAEINRLISRLKFDRERRLKMKQKLDQLISQSPGGPAAQTARELKTLLEQEPLVEA